LQECGQSGEGIVLTIFKGGIGIPFQLDANGEIVAIFTPFPDTDTGMPRTPMDGNILGHCPLTVDDKVGRDLECRDFLEKGVSCGIQSPQKKIVNGVTTEKTWGEADGM